jgi:hypothetical protein
VLKLMPLRMITMAQGLLRRTEKVGHCLLGLSYTDTSLGSVPGLDDRILANSKEMTLVEK